MPSASVWSKTFSVTAESGQENNFELRVPPRGTITALVVHQESGVNVGWRLGLYTKRGACPPNTDGSSASSVSEAGISKSAYQVFAEKSVAAAGSIDEDSKDYAYTNRDGSPSNLQRRLYLQLIPAGTGPKEYSVTLTIATPQFC